MILSGLFLSVACTLPVFTSSRIDSSTHTARIVFADDFSNKLSGWKVLNQDNAFVAYEQNGLHIQVNRPNYTYWSTPGKRYANVVLSVDALKIGGPDNNYYGLICRYQDEKNYYGFLISSDGYYGITRIKEGQIVLLGHDRMVNSDLIQKGTSSNSLQAACKGNQLTLLVNNQALLTVQDEQFLSGDVGVIAGTYNQPGTDILFDNFVAYQP